MGKRILNLTAAPDDPIERLIWLSGVKDAVNAEMDDLWAESYFWARFTGRLNSAIDLHLHGRKKVMAYTRHANEAKGRTVRWNDGLS